MSVLGTLEMNCNAIVFCQDAHHQEHFLKALTEKTAERVAFGQGLCATDTKKRNSKGTVAERALPSLMDFIPPGEPWDKTMRATMCSAEELWALWPSVGEGAFTKVPQTLTLELSKFGM